MATDQELFDETITRLTSLKPEVIRFSEKAKVIRVDSSSLFRGLHKHLLIVLVDSDNIDAAVIDHTHWLNTLVYECLKDSPVVPIVVIDRKPILRLVESLRSRATEGLRGQPVIANFDLGRVDKSQTSNLLRQSIINCGLGHKVNPYNIHNTASSGMFFGRNDELHQLQHPGHFFVLGARRIGKTSLAARYVETVNRDQKHIKIALGNFSIDKKAVMLDVSSLGQHASTAIWTQILKKFDLDPNRWILYSRRSSGRKNPPSEDPAFAVQSLVDMATGKLTIVLDEVDGWIKREASSNWQTIDRLRSFTDDGNAKLILVGYELLRAALQNDRFPLYERGTRITLGPIDDMTLRDLVIKPLADFDITIQSEEVVTKIRKKTGGMPHIVQDVCNIVLNDCLREKKKSVTPRMVSNAFNKSQKYNDFIRGMINCPFPLAEAIAGIIALNCQDAPVQTSTIVSMLRKAGYAYDGEDFELALSYLELRYVIVASDDYRTSWRTFNESLREYMSHSINSRSYETWLLALLQKHLKAHWRSVYQDLI